MTFVTAVRVNLFGYLSAPDYFQVLSALTRDSFFGDDIAERRHWTAEEIRAALALYLRTPFGRIHMRNPDIFLLAGMLTMPEQFLSSPEFLAEHRKVFEGATAQPLRR